MRNASTPGCIYAIDVIAKENSKFMSTWKAALIVALLCSLIGYGYYQTLPTKIVPPTPPPNATPVPDKVKVWQGKPPMPWNIAADKWVNTPVPLKPEQLRGHVTLIEFFRIGCSHCEEAAPHMERMFHDYGPKGLKIIAFQAPGTSAEENDWINVQSTIKRWRLSYPIAFDEKSKVFKKYLAETYPTMLVVDKSGIIRFAQSGFDVSKELKLREQIEQMLGLAPPKPPTMPGGPGQPGAAPGMPPGPGVPPAPGVPPGAGAPPLPPGAGAAPPAGAPLPPGALPPAAAAQGAKSGAGAPGLPPGAPGAPPAPPGMAPGGPGAPPSGPGAPARP